jgi:hypothetical protein
LREVCEVSDAVTAFLDSISSDFYQLPGVSGKFSLSRNSPPHVPDGADIDKYIPLECAEFHAMAFTSHVWRQANFSCVELTKMCGPPCRALAAFSLRSDFSDSGKRTKNSFSAWTICDQAT